MAHKPLLFIALNELNFDLISKYVEHDAERFPGFAKLLNFPSIKTNSEDSYKLLEPWIQWASVYTGREYGKHKIFRLGEIRKYKGELIFEAIESMGYRVGCISPINAENRTKNYGYFIPDPWTHTSPDKSWWSKNLHHSIKFLVQNNAERRINFRSVYIILFAIIYFFKINTISLYIKYLSLFITRGWYRSLLLDLLLSDIEITLRKSRKIDFSFIFFNAGAHIQHHHLLESKHINNEDQNILGVDPIEDMLSLYDKIILRYLKDKSINFIVATGLSQTPFLHKKYYYRLKNHKDFLTQIGFEPISVRVGMSRDFFAKYRDESSAVAAHDIIIKLGINGVPLFGDLQVTGNELFASLNYPHEFKINDNINIKGIRINMVENTVFISIKNGGHSKEGFAFFSSEIAHLMPKNNAHVKFLNRTIYEYFSSINL